MKNNERGIRLSNGVIIVVYQKVRLAHLFVNMSTTKYNIENLKGIADILKSSAKTVRVSPTGVTVLNIRREDIPALLNRLKEFLTNPENLCKIKVPFRSGGA